MEAWSQIRATRTGSPGEPLLGRGAGRAPKGPARPCSPQEEGAGRSTSACRRQQDRIDQVDGGVGGLHAGANDRGAIGADLEGRGVARDLELGAVDGLVGAT